MPIVLSVNGVLETFPIKPIVPRLARIASLSDKTTSGRSALAAQSAYQEQNRQEDTPKPAVLARDLMTTPVVYLPSDSTLAEAWIVMQNQGFRHIPVTSRTGTLEGIVSDRDLLHHVPELITLANTSQAAHRRLAEIMTTRVISATPTTDIRDIARAMLAERIHAIPVLDVSRRPIGILTSHDLLHGVANHGPLELWT